MDHHIYFPIIIVALELKRHRNKIATRLKEIRTPIANGIFLITRGQFNDNYLPVQVDGDKMAGMRLTISSMAYWSVYLKRTGIAITIVIVSRQTPGQYRGSNHPQHQHYEHANTNIQ